MIYLWLHLAYILKQQFLDSIEVAPRKLQGLTSLPVRSPPELATRLSSILGIELLHRQTSCRGIWRLEERAATAGPNFRLPAFELISSAKKHGEYLALCQISAVSIWHCCRDLWFYARYHLSTTLALLSDGIACRLCPYFIIIQIS